MRMQPRCNADFCFVHGQKGCMKSSCFTKVLAGKLRLETGVHPLTRIPGHMSSLDVRKAVFSSLGAGEHGFYSKINTIHLSGAVRQPGVRAKIRALQETLRPVCIFSQSDWSKTQPLMCHFKWTPGPNENTYTYKPHLIEGYRFSHSRQFLILPLRFSKGKREQFLKINILNLFSCKLKLPFLGWCHGDQHWEMERNGKYSSKVLYFM